MKNIFRTPRLIFLVVLLYQPLPSGATTDVPFSSTQIDEVSKHNKWLSLLYFRADWLTLEPQSSEDGSAFFLSKDGKHNPRSELMANLKAMNDKNYVCRFPARSDWLSRVFELPPPDLSHCQSYQQWLKQMSSDKVVLVYAAASNGNPASSFGHTFLRLDNHHRESILSPTFNFAAATTQEGFLSYSLKGLTGGYYTSLVISPYYRKIREYADWENRELLEFELNLSKREINELINLLWEIRTAEFHYYFIDENCSRFPLQLMQTLRPESELLAASSRSTLPAYSLLDLYRHGFIADQAQKRPSLHEQITTSTQLATKTNHRQWQADLLSNDRHILKDKLPRQQLKTERKRLLARKPQARTPLPAIKTFKSGAIDGTHGPSRFTLQYSSDGKRNQLLFAYDFIFHGINDHFSPLLSQTQFANIFKLKIRRQDNILSLKNFDLVSLKEYETTTLEHSDWLKRFYLGFKQYDHQPSQTARFTLGIGRGIGRKMGPLSWFAHVDLFYQFNAEHTAYHSNLAELRNELFLASGQQRLSLEAVAASQLYGKTNQAFSTYLNYHYIISPRWKISSQAAHHYPQSGPHLSLGLHYYPD